MATRKGVMDALSPAAAIHDRALTVPVLDAWVDALGDFPDAAIAAAVREHMRDPDRGRFFPKPADIIAVLRAAGANDGRPSADEAWSMLPFDEAASVVWTDEMAQAWGSASACMPDRVAARMAFRAAYDRLVADARQRGVRARWTASLGHDKDSRAAVIERAVELGRLSREHAEGLLPAPQTPPAQVLGLLEQSAPPGNEAARQALDEIRRMLGAKR